MIRLDNSGTTVYLDEHELSDKLIVFGIDTDNGNGMMAICRYKDGGMRDYMSEVRPEDVGHTLVQLIFCDAERIKFMAKELDKLYKAVKEFERNEAGLLAIAARENGLLDLLKQEAEDKT